jgi:hypothetical protein
MAYTVVYPYYSTHIEATIRYYAADMQLKIYVDASYHSDPREKARTGG